MQVRTRVLYHTGPNGAREVGISLDDLSTSSEDSSEDTERQSTTNEDTYCSDVSAHSASHGDPPATPPANTAHDARDPGTADESERADEHRPPNIPVEHPGLPDDADDDVECAGRVEVEAEVSRDPDRVEAATDANGDDAGRPGRLTEPLDGVENGTWPPDVVQNPARPPEGIPVEPGGDTSKVGSGRNECVAHGCADAGVDGDGPEWRQDADIKGEKAGKCRGK